MWWSNEFFVCNGSLLSSCKNVCPKSVEVFSIGGSVTAKPVHGYRPLRIVMAFHVFVEFRAVHMLWISVEAMWDGHRYRSTFVKSAGRGPRPASYVPRVVTSPQLSEDLANYRRNIKNGAWNKLAALAVVVGYIDLRDTPVYRSGLPANRLLFICKTFAVSGLCVRVYEYAG